MKKTIIKIITSSTVLFLVLILFLNKKHQDYKELKAENSLDFKKQEIQVLKWIKEDEENFKFHSGDLINHQTIINKTNLINSSQEILILNKKLLSTLKKGIRDSDKDSRIEFIPFVFNVFLK